LITSAGAPPAIHIVDDDVAVRESLGLLFESYQYNVKSYGSAVDFLEDPGRGSGCLLLDLNMPVMSGIELLQLLRKQNSKLPVIVFTGRADPQLRLAVENLGARTLLEKPVDADALLDLVQEIMKESPI
jgi:FixJ family two-component response regulator